MSYDGENNATYQQDDDIVSILSCHQSETQLKVCFYCGMGLSQQEECLSQWHGETRAETERREKMRPHERGRKMEHRAAR